MLGGPHLTPGLPGVRSTHHPRISEGGPGVSIFRPLHWGDPQAQRDLRTCSHLRQQCHTHRESSAKARPSPPPSCGTEPPLHPCPPLCVSRSLWAEGPPCVASDSLACLVEGQPILAPPDAATLPAQGTFQKSRPDMRVCVFSRPWLSRSPALRLPSLWSLLKLLSPPDLQNSL